MCLIYSPAQLLHLGSPHIPHPITRAGIGVWLTDVDAIFHSDPFLHISPGYEAHLLYDTPFLPDGEKSPLMVKTRHFHFLSLSLYPSPPSTPSLPLSLSLSVSLPSFIFCPNCSLSTLPWRGMLLTIATHILPRRSWPDVFLCGLARLSPQTASFWRLLEGIKGQIRQSTTSTPSTSCSVALLPP